MATDRTAPGIIFLCPISFSVIREIQGVLPVKPEAAVYRCGELSDAVKAIVEVERAVVLVTASEPPHLKIAAELCTLLRSAIQSQLARVCVITELEFPDRAHFLKSTGIHETLSPNLAATALKLKIMAHVQAVETAWKAGGTTPLAGPTQAEIDSLTNPERAVLTAVRALKIADDCWIFRGKAFQRIDGLWVLRAQGPSPANGRWLKADGPASGKADAWAWTPRDPLRDPFVSEGVWVFHGRQPESIDGHWVFKGELPRLTYIQCGQEVAHRFEATADGELRVAKNSRAALAKADAIAATYFRDDRKKGGPSENQEPGKAVPGTAKADLDTAIGPPAPLFSDGRFGDKIVVDPSRLTLYEDVLDDLGPRDDMFQSTTSRKNCLPLLKEAGHLKAGIVFWTRGQKLRRESRVEKFHAGSGSLEIGFPPDLNWNRMLEAFRELDAREIYFNANLGRTAIFFRQPLSAVRGSDRGFEVDCPEKLYEVQRRKHFRHAFDPKQDLRARIVLADGATTVWKMVDISAGGLCLLRETRAGDSVSRLKQGDRILNVHFDIYKRAIQCPARVAWAIRRGTETRIGIEFEKIKRADREGIRLFVMEENYAYFKNAMARVSSDQ